MNISDIFKELPKLPNLFLHLINILGTVNSNNNKKRCSSLSQIPQILAKGKTCREGIGCVWCVRKSSKQEGDTINYLGKKAPWKEHLSSIFKAN